MASQLQARSDDLQLVPPAAPEIGPDDVDLLHQISVELIGERDRTELYGKIVDAAVSITRSQFGTMQLLCPKDDPSGHGGQLQLLCHRGLPPHAVKFWQWVKPTAHSSCTVALKVGQRAIIPDFEAWDDIAGTPDLVAFREAGIRAAQTTPLLSRDGALLRMISTHWTEPHRPSARDLRLLDILARQAADLLERTIREEALQTREQELERACEALRDSELRQTMLTGEMSHRVKNLFALVNTMIRFGAKSATDKDDFARSLSGRLHALAEAHHLVLAGEATASVSELEHIIRSVVEPHQSADSLRFDLTGAAVSVRPESISGLALVINELATNAIKYGALASDEGTVAVSWSTEDDHLSVRWEERGGAAVEAAPERIGFGSRLLDSTIVRQFGGAFSHDWQREGVVVSIKLPLTSILG
ncbi:HWE histidine kinase domain-containing protein [Bosea sp. BK604]|uniref:HWE histidine kinase domain-containing protein n=1 Tax=Bosea sp. BK604 TaxID=2512180 RepID=UPI00104E07D2|nr:HWE histidine kinase domain-containing protein [Bosea sp. BK604]TCR63089.1 two-component sensor histidine kinase [Bosea sp. BK604]